jgi:hypothetical protein
MADTEDGARHRAAIHSYRRTPRLPGCQPGHLIFAIIATKEHLWEYILKEVLTDPRPAELYQEADLFQLVEQFFDRAIYFAVIGYEGYQAAQGEGSG